MHGHGPCSSLCRSVVVWAIKGPRSGYRGIPRSSPLELDPAWPPDKSPNQSQPDLGSKVEALPVPVLSGGWSCWSQVVTHGPAFTKYMVMSQTPHPPAETTHQRSLTPKLCGGAQAKKWQPQLTAKTLHPPQTQSMQKRGEHLARAHGTRLC